ncbi:hypothetical protein B4O97_14315 [Marispirochaeta aestuarii]|uniref:HTH tetR-type domain-containing protein n=1 Tax=Marispirochaeta aestuarii TaxID=1963862 RepID=A0A1Y1RWZ5_9SPIO|nr:TetR/AcrR family transcriptional regulator [Marispirochaeta aestuarii]ORC34055.1 hypothetical protein B4O97_14315 [Marispirochaeta aestuarii]
MTNDIDRGTEEQILAAAYRVIIRRGKSGTRMQEIADEAGVNKALLHYYFRSKDRIYEAVLRKVLSSLLKSMLQSIDFSMPIREVLEAFIRGHIGALKSNPQVFQFFMAEMWTNREEVIPVFVGLLTENREIITTRFFARLQQAMDDGEIRRVNPFHFLMNIISLDVFYFVASPLFFAVLNVPEKEQEAMTGQRADQVVEFIWESIRPREESGCTES